VAARCFAAAFFVCALFLSGCTAGPTLTSTTPVSAPGTGAAGAALQGRVHGGQNPIQGAHVYLYAVNDTGYAGPGEPASPGNQAVSLLASAVNTSQDTNGNYYVTTASDGTFSVTGDYTCPTATPYTYLLAVGGNSGSGNNPAIALVTGLGDCTGSGFSQLNVMVNEVSTVAATFAGAGFATDATHVSSSSTALAKRGVEDAYAAIVNLEALSTGVASATSSGGNGVVPQSEINTLANIVAACVNSTGSGSSACTTLFSNATNGSIVPTDTTTAMLNIAHNPGANVQALFGLQTASSPFQPDLPTYPNDFTIAIDYTGGGIDYPWGIAVDSTDHIWIVNNGTNGPLTVLSPLGAVLSGTDGITTGGLFVPVNIAIDGNGNVWVPDDPSSKLSEFNSSGTANSSSPYTGGGMDTPHFIAVDGSNNIWISNTSAATLSEFSSSGSPITGSSGYTASNFQGQNLIADASGNIWVTSSSGSGGIFEFNSSGQASSPITTGGGLDTPAGIAIDPAGNVWVTNGNSTISEFSPSGSPISSSSGYSGGGLNGPTNLAVDGAGDVWVISSGFIGYLSEFNSSGQPLSGSGGYQANNLYHCQGIAIDGSGNVWVTNFYQTNGVIEFVGAAAPVVTPMAANLQSPYGAHAVNRP
jgi:streptogramin lyase